MKQTAFCTLFDSHYMPQGLSLLASLRKHHPDTPVYVLALDDAVKRRLAGDNNVYALKEVAQADYWNAVKARDVAEQAWTLTPYWMNWLLERAAGEELMYLDADSFLFRSLEPALVEYRQASVGIVPHRFPPRLQWRAAHNGEFNVNAVYLKNDETGRACAELWRDQCLAWCYRKTQRSAEGHLLFGDQGYLDGWQHLFNAHALEHTGINLAPWNQEQYGYAFDRHLYVVSHSDPEQVNVTRIDPLLMYHFHELKVEGSRIHYGGYATYLKKEIVEHVYNPYVKQLRSIL